MEPGDTGSTFTLQMTPPAYTLKIDGYSELKTSAMVIVGPVIFFIFTRGNITYTSKKQLKYE